MKILIAEDNNDKVTKLIGALTDCGLSRDDIHVAYTIFDTKRELRDQCFDLLILDVLLPNRAGDEPRQAGTLDLLTELSDRATLRKPKHIIGLTAYDDALKEAGPAFVARTWTMIKYSPDKEEWREQVKRCVAYIRDVESQPSTRTYRSDLCVVTALAYPEFDAVMRLPWNWRVSEPIDDNTFVRRGEFSSGGTTFSVTAAHAPRMGMVSSALLTSKLIEREVPRFVVMTGICAGIKGKVNIGDVVVADPAWDWQSGKHFVEAEEHGFAIAPDPIGLASFIRARVDQMRMEREIWTAIRSNWPSPPDTELKLRSAPMASGSSVLADPDVVDRIIEQNRNLAAIEMEAFGVVAAASLASHPRPTAFICKSVCDFANPDKDDHWQSYAAYCSAQAVRIFFEKHMIDIVRLSGTP